jgi:DNA-binding transcriptional LysR family regulator
MLAVACDVVSAPGRSLGYAAPEQAVSQYRDARAKAASGHKRVLILAGGDWCRWCHVIDRFLRHHPDIESQLHASYVLVKIAVEDDGADHPVLGALPRPTGYPHFWIVAPDGRLIASVETLPLEAGDNDYDAGRFSEFLRRHAAPTP